jgi:hypothetical protein
MDIISIRLRKGTGRATRTRGDSGDATLFFDTVNLFVAFPLGLL